MTNYSTAVMLFNDDIKAISVTYEPDTESTKQKRTIFKTVDHDIKEGDMVVVPTDTRHGFTVVKVDAVDVEVDFNSSELIKWVVSKVSNEGYEAILEKEKKWIDTIKASEKRKQREDIKKNMVEMAKEQGIDLETIAAAKLNSLTAIESKVEK